MKVICDSTKTKGNRTTTYESLMGLAYCITAEDKETFIKAYELGTHDNCGGAAWYYLYGYLDRRHIRQGVNK